MDVGKSVWVLWCLSVLVNSCYARGALNRYGIRDAGCRMQDAGYWIKIGNHPVSPWVSTLGAKGR